MISVERSPAPHASQTNACEMLNCSEHVISLSFMQQPAYINIAPPLEQSVKAVKVLKKLSGFYDSFTGLSGARRQKDICTHYHILNKKKKGFVKAYHRQLFQLSVLFQHYFLSAWKIKHTHQDSEYII